MNLSPFLARCLPGLTALGILSLPSVAAPAAPEYHQVARWEVGGEGGWDYLTFDAAGKRLFITRGSHVMVVSTETGKVTADIAGVQGCHGVALAPDLGKGFISSGGNDQVTVFDLATLKTTGTIAVGKRPDAILYDPATKRVFTFNAQSQDTTAIDATTDKVVGTLALGGKPEFAQTDRKGHVFVNVEDTSELVTFDPKSLKVLHRTLLAPAEEPSGLALDTKTHHLFAVCGNKKAAVVDTETGKLLGTPTIGDGPDAAAFDPELGVAFTSNGEGTMTLLKETAPGTYTTTTVKTEPGARTMTIDPTTHRVFLVTARFTPPPAGASGNNGRPARPRPVPGSFVILVYGPQS